MSLAWSCAVRARGAICQSAAAACRAGTTTAFASVAQPQLPRFVTDPLARSDVQGLALSAARRHFRSAISSYPQIVSRAGQFIAVPSRTASTQSKAAVFGSAASFLPSMIGSLAQGSIGYNVVLSLLIATGTNVVGWAICVVTKTHKVTDLIGTGTFAVSAWATQAAAMHGHGLSVGAYYKPLFLTIGVTFWSVRLAGYLFYRILQTKTDKRFDGFYPKSEDEPWLTGETKFPLKLAGFWAVQALWAFTVLLPVTVAQAANPTAKMGAWGWIGFALFMSCAIFEATADFQKDRFKKKPENKGDFCNTGLFRLCQFPNYFGEIASWWAMFFWAGFPGVFIPYGYIIVSPIVTSLLLRFGSGVAMTKKSQEERYGDRQDYRDYVASTPLLFPFMKPFYAGKSSGDAPQQLMQGSGDQDSTGETSK